MEKEHIKMAILRQEQMFKQQVHELHRVYQVQKQLMMEMQIIELNRAQASANTETKPKIEILHHISNVDQKQSYSYLHEKASFVEDFDLELTLATGSSRRKQQKSSNSNSGATMSSSTSAESESGRFREPDVPLRFQNESKRHDDQMLQSPWLYQCLGLKMA